MHDNTTTTGTAQIGIDDADDDADDDDDDNDDLGDFEEEGMITDHNFGERNPFRISKFHIPPIQICKMHM
ncbi:unnamed protein product [Ambrosiozyma monospora]|uniref:Unnamed protein product n=1 Tax=Ambrosiozyma monospora TaxID=43982 RepID=A0A9W6Z5G2_AMBMO|nr:unnamed protein product [Ambrosiozyma monospora]